MKPSLVLAAVLAGCGGEGGGGGGDCADRPIEPPTPRGELAGVLDEAQGRIVVYGGNEAAPESCMPRYAIIDELWAFQLDCASWERLDSTGGPGVRARHSVALDSQRGRMLLFGGRQRNAADTGWDNFADAWALDLAAGTWEALGSSGTQPSPRSSATAVYDPGKDRLLVFGGNTSTSGLTLTGVGDLYALDLATLAWSRIDAAGAPSPRLFHAATVVGGEMIVYGGTPSFDGPFLDDAHAFDLASDTWRLVAASGPGERFGAALLPAGDSALVVGGHDNTNLGNRNDVWALDVSSGTWQQLRPGDTLNGAAAGQCDFPPDFTLPEENSPERRYAFATATSPTDAWILGGKTDCGNVNDVWQLSLPSASWTLRRASTDGEACNRTGRTDCTTLCF
jgi:N-acetylneuraminic acid mutarotase